MPGDTAAPKQWPPAIDRFGHFAGLTASLGLPMRIRPYRLASFADRPRAGIAVGSGPQPASFQHPRPPTRRI
jgi:hypothetical protein